MIPACAICASSWCSLSGLLAGIQKLLILLESKAIIFFDGICNFCNSSVNFIIKRDKKNYFKFASLQSEFAGKFLESCNLVPKVHSVNGNTEKKLDSIILFENNNLYIKSTAALRIAKHLNGLWKIFFIFIIVPPFIRNFFYDIIAKNRYKWFGKRE